MFVMDNLTLGIAITDYTGCSALKSSKLLKNGLLNFSVIACKTCMVCLKFTDVIIFINNHLLIYHRISMERIEY